ncbi:hypothetical protein HQN90_22730 [Paenibacillus alba]|uniref:hypothetical protein n=1 Tax=Paenibacillus alba TaxID=1197127 RepID=UPI0015630E9C|nr:hypothetical protein [Paenibacillus alba]NQX68948.1 hypothetical protein [Paenibacillus alba]
MPSGNLHALTAPDGTEKRLVPLVDSGAGTLFASQNLRGGRSFLQGESTADKPFLGIRAGEAFPWTDRHHDRKGNRSARKPFATNKSQGEEQASMSMSVSSPKRGKERGAAGSAFVKSRLSLAAARTRV